MTLTAPNSNIDRSEEDRISIEKLHDKLQSNDARELEELDFTGNIFFHDENGVEQHLALFHQASAWGIMERFAHLGISVNFVEKKGKISFVEKKGKISIVVENSAALTDGYKILTVSEEINNRVSSLV